MRTGKKNLVITPEWEQQAFRRIAQFARSRRMHAGNAGILQLSAEYSGIMGQRLSHMLSHNGDPMPIEVVDIPYAGEFAVSITPDQMDPYERLLIVDSGCLSGMNFTNVCNLLLDYGFPREQLVFACVACDTRSRFSPDVCPVFFDGNTQVVHFWWESKTRNFGK